MKSEIKVPSVGESITTGVLVTWMVNNGEYVKEGDIIFELETDKATMEIPSTASGNIEIIVEQGTEVSIGQTVAMVTSAEGKKQQEAKPEPTPQKSSAAEKVEQVSIPESNKNQPNRTDSRRTEKIPMSNVRRKTAQRLLKATQSSAYLTTFNEINMEKIIEIRTQYKEKFQKEHGIKIGFMSFFIKACCQALKEFPSVNTQLDENVIVYKYFYDIGVAVSIDEGLIVPVIRDADTKHFAQLEAVIADLAQRAKEKKILPDELTGGTFTITNGGIFGSLLSTPIPAYPQTAILGMHAIKKRPIVIDDQIVIQPMMYVALTYDHQVIDGKDAVGFLNRVKEFIEQPDELLLEL